MSEMTAVIHNAIVRMVENFEEKKWNKVRRQYYWFNDEQRDIVYGYIQDKVPDNKHLLEFLATVEQFENNNGGHK